MFTSFISEDLAQYEIELKFAISGRGGMVPKVGYSLLFSAFFFLHTDAFLHFRYFSFPVLIKMMIYCVSAELELWSVGRDISFLRCAQGIVQQY